MTLFGMTIEEFIATISAIVVLIFTIAKANKHDAKADSTEMIYIILKEQIEELEKSNKRYKKFYRKVIRAFDKAIDYLRKTSEKIEKELEDGNIEF